MYVASVQRIKHRHETAARGFYYLPCVRANTQKHSVTNTPASIHSAGISTLAGDEDRPTWLAKRFLDEWREQHARGERATPPPGPRDPAAPVLSGPHELLELGVQTLLEGTVLASGPQGLKVRLPARVARVLLQVLDRGFNDYGLDIDWNVFHDDSAQQSQAAEPDTLVSLHFSRLALLTDGALNPAGTRWDLFHSVQHTEAVERKGAVMTNSALGCFGDLSSKVNDPACYARPDDPSLRRQPNIGTFVVMLQYMPITAMFTLDHLKAGSTLWYDYDGIYYADKYWSSKDTFSLRISPDLSGAAEEVREVTRELQALRELSIAREAQAGPGVHVNGVGEVAALRRQMEAQGRELEELRARARAASAAVPEEGGQRA